MRRSPFHRIAREIPITLGIILIWRGIWVALDLFDRWLFDGNHLITALIGVVLGVVLLYIADNELRTLERI